jgi:hypothetical protein
LKVTAYKNEVRDGVPAGGALQACRQQHQCRHLTPRQQQQHLEGMHAPLLWATALKQKAITQLADGQDLNLEGAEIILFLRHQAFNRLLK